MWNFDWRESLGIAAYNDGGYLMGKSFNSDNLTLLGRTNLQSS